MDNTAENERWLALAQEATRFRMHDAAMTWLAHTHNAIFLLQREGEKYVMRLSKPETLEHCQSEIKWLQALRKHTALVVPDMQLLYYSTNKVTAVYWDYIEGEPRTGAQVTVEEMQQIGIFLATLHNVPLKFINQWIQPHYYRLDYEGLFGANSIYHPGEASAIFTAEENQVMQAVQAKVKSAMDEIGTSRQHFGLIHGDLLLKNILFHAGEVRALDFEYCGYGYYLYDLAPLLWQLKTESRYQTFEDALWQGYTSMRLLPRRALLETFIAGRQVASMRWIAMNQHHPFVAGKAREILQQRTNELRGFLETGVLRRKL